MARIEISGVGIEYELLGQAGNHAVSITPGGRTSKEAAGIRELGEALAAGGKRVLLWDRPNCGLSDICFEDDSESAMQGRILTGLIRALDLGPTAVCGGSSGSRTALYAALQDPGAVSHLVMWWISGGATSLLNLGAAYYGKPAVTARLNGLAGVLDLPQWDPIKNDPQKREAFLKLDVDYFVDAMERWAESFVPSEPSPVPGLAKGDFGRLAMPVLIVRGADSDIYHSDRVSLWVHELTLSSTLVDPPWSDEAPMERLGDAVRTGASPFIDWPLLAPTLLEFTSHST